MGTWEGKRVERRRDADFGVGVVGCACMQLHVIVVSERESIVADDGKLTSTDVGMSFVTENGAVVDGTGAEGGLSNTTLDETERGVHNAGTTVASIASRGVRRYWPPQ